jgi:histone H2A
MVLQSSGKGGKAKGKGGKVGSGKSKKAPQSRSLKAGL